MARWAGLAAQRLDPASLLPSTRGQCSPADRQAVASEWTPGAGHPLEVRRRLSSGFVSLGTFQGNESSPRIQTLPAFPGLGRSPATQALSVPLSLQPPLQTASSRCGCRVGTRAGASRLLPGQGHREVRRQSWVDLGLPRLSTGLSTLGGCLLGLTSDFGMKGGGAAAIMPPLPACALTSSLTGL